MGKTFHREDRNKKDWYITYNEPNGRRVRKRVGPSKKLAEAALKKIEVSMAEGKYLEVKSESRIKFVDFADEYYRVYCVGLKSCRKSHDVHLKILRKLFAGKHLDEINPLDIEKFKTERRKTVSPATVNRTLACLKSLFNKAIAWDKFDGTNPVNKVEFYKENNTRLRYLEKEEITRLINNCNEQLRPIVIVALNTGMRKGEILGLKWRDIDFRRDVLYLMDTKNGERREVPLNIFVKDSLIKIRKHPNSSYVFCYTDGSPVKDIRKSFFTALKKSDINNFRFHDTRHTAASHLVMAGVDLNTVREILGHKDIKMTLRYAHLSPGHKKRAVDVLGQSIAAKDKKSKNLVPTRSPEQGAEELQSADSILTI